jgi:hypothetical protein
MRSGSLTLDMHIVNSCPHLPSSVFGISYLSPEGIGTQADVFYAKVAAFRQSPAAEHSARVRNGP